MTKWSQCHLSGDWATSEKDRTCLLKLPTARRPPPLYGDGDDCWGSMDVMGGAVMRLPHQGERPTQNNNPPVSPGDSTGRI